MVGMCIFFAFPLLLEQTLQRIILLLLCGLYGLEETTGITVCPIDRNRR